jgi:uncharacterized DUF497 family protein
MVEVEFDSAKNAKNIRERGLPFTLAEEFDWTTAMIAPSNRPSEARFFAVGYIGSRLHALVFTKSGTTLRIISLRRAHKTEVKRYEEAKAKS